ncbi:MAG: hypothetical protein ACE5LH_01890 [Fidelibacterota bacterium]
METNGPRSKILLAVLPLIGGLAGIGVVHYETKPRLLDVTFEAEKYAYTPARLRVSRGDTLRIRLVSKDVTHGFYLEGFGVEAYARAQFPTFYVRKSEETKGESEYEMVESYPVIADRVGKFRYRCSVTCGPMHPFMQGELIVGPNYPFAAAIGLSLGVMIVSVLGFAWPWWKSKGEQDLPEQTNDVDANEK